MVAPGREESLIKKNKRYNDDNADNADNEEEEDKDNAILHPPVWLPQEEGSLLQEILEKGEIYIIFYIYITFYIYHYQNIYNI